MPDMKMVRQVVFWKRHFFEFYDGLEHQAQRKVERTLNLIRILDRIPEQYFKHLTDTNGLFEVRVMSGGNDYRIFSFFNKGGAVVLLNGFQKKSMKTPRREIQKALLIKYDYENQKERSDNAG